MHEVLVNRFYPGFDSRSGKNTFVSPSADSRRAVVSYWRKYVHEVLVNRLRGLSLPRKSVVRLTDRPDITISVYRGRKTTTQQQHASMSKYRIHFVCPAVHCGVRLQHVNDGAHPSPLLLYPSLTRTRYRKKFKYWDMYV